MAAPSRCRTEPIPAVECDEPINRSQQVPLRHMPFERELVKQRILPDAAFSDHQTHSDPPDRIESAQPSAGNSVLLQRNRLESGQWLSAIVDQDFWDRLLAR